MKTKIFVTTFLLVMLIGCKDPLTKDDVSRIYVDAINTGNFQQLDDITGPNFLEERVVRCKFLVRMSDRRDSCTHEDVLRRWDKFVRDLNLYMAPCKLDPNFVDREPKTHAEIIQCGEHEDVIFMTKEKDGWRLSGTFERSQNDLEKALLIERMAKE